MKTHYYSPIPDTSKLPDSLWKVNYNLGLINISAKNQRKLLRDFSYAYKREYDTFPLHNWGNKKNSTYYIYNGLFESVDAEILYCMIRHFKPSRIFEIGSGFSTLITSKAVRENKKEGFLCSFESFDPYPSDVLKIKPSGLKKLHVLSAQDIKLNRFQELRKNDILFIDSSHILKIGSDVQYEILRVLPVLKKGTIIHIHDIFLPEEYPKEWIMKYHRFSTEQYLLYAFLIFNNKFRVLWASRYMHIKYPKKLKLAFRSYDYKLATPESFWIQKIA